MEFSLYGTKFNYEYSNIYQLYEYKKGHEWKERKIQNNSKGYKCFQFSVSNKKCTFLLHRLVYWLHNRDWDIMDSSKDNSIDHIDGDKLNNNIENLRVVTLQENNWNRTKAKGYYFDRGKWRAHIHLNNKTIYLGTFDKEVDARNAYLDAKKKYHIIR
jgi:nucleoside-specific outer membrane channel protein Tsx